VKGGAETVALHAWVSGRVQGVYFRESTRRRAQELGLCGWVRNLRDGRVEALFVGPRAACEGALAFVRVGPPAADVSAVEFHWEDAPSPPPVGFAVR
jgi:acylphosphatase